MVLITRPLPSSLQGLTLLYLFIASEAFSPNVATTIGARVPAKDEWHQAGNQVDAVENYRISTLKAKRDDDDDDSSKSDKKLQEEIEALRREMANAKNQRGNETLRRCKLEYTDADTMILDIPPSGMNRMDVMRGAISVAVSSPLLLLGMLPFKALIVKPVSMLIASPVLVIAGGLVKESIYDPFTSSQLIVGEICWSVEERFLGKCIRKEQGVTRELSSATVNPWVWDVRMPNEDEVFRMTLVTKLDDAVDFGLSRSDCEFGYLASEIDNHLKFMQMKVKVQEYSESLKETSEN